MTVPDLRALLDKWCERCVEVRAHDTSGWDFRLIGEEEGIVSCINDLEKASGCDVDESKFRVVRREDGSLVEVTLRDREQGR